MTLTPQEKDLLTRYIRLRTCEEYRRGESCLDRDGRGHLVEGRHQACREAGIMRDLVEKC